MFKLFKKLFKKWFMKNKKKGVTTLNVKELIKRLRAGEQLTDEELAVIDQFTGANDSPPGDEGKPEDKTEGSNNKGEEENKTPEDNSANEGNEEQKPNDPSQNEDASEGGSSTEDNPNGQESSEDGEGNKEVPNNQQPPMTPPAVPPLNPDTASVLKEFKEMIQALRTEVEDVRMLVIETNKKKQEVQNSNGPTLSPNPVMKKGFFDFE